MSYTVKPGDNLSTIGQRLGINWRQITGFRSGNPNLIYPGEVLSWPGDSGSAAPAAPTPAAPTPGPVQELKDAQTTIVDEYGKEEKKYNKAIGDYGAVAKGWQDIFADGDMEFDAATGKWKQSPGTTAALTGENADKYKGLLDALSQNAYLDPYFEQKLASGDIASMGTEDILKKYLIETPTTDGKTKYDSGIQGVGYETLRALAEGASIEEANRQQAAKTYARDLLSKWGQAGSSVNSVYNETTGNAAKTGLGGGVANRKLADLSSTSASMMGDIAASDEDWRTNWLKDNRITNQDYAKKTRNEELLNARTDIITNSGITNADLKQKYLTGTTLN